MRAHPKYRDEEQLPETYRFSGLLGLGCEVLRLIHLSGVVVEFGV